MSVLLSLLGLRFPLPQFDWQFFLFSCAIVPIYTVVMSRIFRHVLKTQHKNEERLTAWTLSTLTATSMVCVGVWTVWQLLQQEGPGALLWDVAAFRRLALSSPLVCHRACVYFLAHCLMDLLQAPVLYPKEMGGSMVFHHVVYGHFMLYAISMGGEFGVSIFFLVELPTLLLAIGHVHNPWRQDLTFGVSWFVLRLVYHFLGSVMLTRSLWDVAPYSAFIGWLGFSLHLLWFKGWCASYFGKAKKDQKPEESKGTEDQAAFTNIATAPHVSPSHTAMAEPCATSATSGNSKPLPAGLRERSANVPQELQGL